MKQFFARLLVLLTLSLISATASAAPFQLSYSGRLTEASGKPIVGTVDLQLKLYSHPTDPTLIAVTIPQFDDVVLASGVFQLELNLTSAEYQTAFGGAGDVWAEVKDVTHNKTYPRQRFMAVPYALQVPVDGVTVRFNAAGQLESLTGGSGDMTKAQYDTNAATTNTVDAADHATTADSATNADDAADSALLNGNPASFYLDAGNLTGNVAYARLPTGTTANTVAAGNDARMTNSRAPNGAAGGDLAGTYPNPTVASVSDGALSANVTKLGSLISLTGEVENVLPVANGGTGAATLTGLVKGNGTGAFTTAALSDIPVGYRLNASDGLPVDALYVDAAGKVGIGTTTPTYKLQVEGGMIRGNLNATGPSLIVQGTNSNLQVTHDGASNVGLFNSGGGIEFRQPDGTTNTMTVGSTGNVGIGTTSPAYLLDVKGTPGSATAVRIGRATNTDKADLIFAPNGALSASNVQYNVGIDAAMSNFQIRHWDGVTTLRDFTVDTNGNVGIGTDSPSNKLTVGGTTAQSNALMAARGAGNSLEFGHGNTAGYASVLGSEVGTGQPFLCFSCEAGTNSNTFMTRGLQGAKIGTANNLGITFSTMTNANADNQTATELMRIGYNGNVGIGTTGPVAKLEVNGAVKIGDMATCTATEAGSIRYNSGTFQGCNGTTWTGITDSWPMGYIYGLTLANNGTDPNRDIDIAAGAAKDSSNTFNMTLASGITKQLDAAWAAGTNAGGLFSGSIANSTWYHVFLIRKTSDGTIDAGFDTSVTAANIPTGYSAYRRIGSVRTNGSSNILRFLQLDNEFLWDTPVFDANGVATNTTFASRTLTVPSGLSVRARVRISDGWGVSLKHPTLTGYPTPTTTLANADALQVSGSGAIHEVDIWTNTSSQIQWATSIGTTNSIRTFGWVDPRN